MSQFNYSSDDVSIYFRSKSEVDQAIVRLIWVIRFDGMHVYPPLSGSPPSSKPHRIRLSPLIPSFKKGKPLKAREILYFFRSYEPPLEKKDQFTFLDTIRQEFITWGVMSENFFNAFIEKRITREKLNKHLSSLVQRGILSRDTVHHTYSPGDDWISDMRTFHDLRRFVTSAPSRNARSINRCSIVYPVDRTLIGKKHGFGKFDIRAFEGDVARIISDAGSEIRTSMIENLRRENESMKEACRRIGIPSDNLNTSQARDVLFDIMPVIVLDPLARTFLPD